TLFSEVAELPGTADLIEITKDNEFKIYDFKTTTSFFYKGKEKSNWNLFVKNGYVNQLLIYSAILQEYNIKPAKGFLNILAIEIDKHNMVTDNIVRITEIKNKNIDPLGKEFSSYVRDANNKILPRFTNSQKLKDFNFKKEED